MVKVIMKGKRRPSGPQAISDSEASDYKPQTSSPESHVSPGDESEEFFAVISDDDDDGDDHPLVRTKMNRVPVKRKIRNAKASSSSIAARAPGSRKRGSAIGGDKEVLGDIEDITSVSRDHEVSYHDVEDVAEIQQKLLDWFDDVRDKRGMPWRKRYDPSLSMEQKGQRAYEIWVSEVMLQQTQVNTVIAYWQRWIEKWPTVADLAQADIEEVNAAWRGLGYYRRARSLLAGAKTVMGDSKFQGRLPDDPAILEREVDGVGRYTAGAICSMAYGVRTPIVDGNIHRLFTRVLALHAVQTAPSTIKHLWSAASRLVQRLPKEDRRGVAGDYNQALMELGSQICKPLAPDCGSCPLQSACNAYAELSRPPPSVEKANCDLCEPIPSAKADAVTIPSVTVFPMKKEKKVSRIEEEVVCVAEWRSSETRRWLFVKRPEKGLLAGLFEPPTTPVATGSNIDDHTRASLATVSQLLRPSGEEIKAMIASMTEVSSIPHIFSHINMTYHIQYLILSPPQSTLESETSSSTKGPPSVVLGDRLAVWLNEMEVEAANVGTGVKKVWAEIFGSWGQFDRPKANVLASKKSVVIKKNAKSSKKASSTSRQSSASSIGNGKNPDDDDSDQKRKVRKIMMPVMPGVKSVVV